MPLVAATLETELKKVFSDMNIGNADTGYPNAKNKFLADGIATAVKNFVSTGIVTTVDTGVLSGNPYVGAGTGTMEIKDTPLAQSLLDVFSMQDDAPSDSQLALDMALKLHDSLSAQNNISTNTVGTVTPPPPATPIPGSGTGKGKVLGVPTIIQGLLTTCFAQMKEAKSGGNDLFASMLSTAVATYLTSGVVSVILDAPLTGSGTGVIA